MKRLFPHVCAALFALMVLCSVTTRAADNVYAILYDDGTLTFQHGNTPESGKTVTGTYTVDMEKGYPTSWSNSDQCYHSTAPWDNRRSDIKTISFRDKIAPRSVTGWFCSCRNLTEMKSVHNLDTSHITSMECMFSRCNSLTTLDVSHFDTANVTSMSEMFEYCRGLTTLDVSHFDTANVTSMYEMFEGCSGLTALDVSHFDTANVTSMSWMFYGCSGLTALDVSHFDTANVQYMSWMFYGCSGLTALDVSKFNTTNVTSMSYMFYGCSGLTALDVSHFDTANVTSMSSMFRGCSGLTALDVSHFDTANVQYMYDMFYGCSGLTALDLSNFNTAKVKDIGWMFYGCSNLKLICASDKFTTSSVPEDSDNNSHNMFYGCASLVGGNGTKYDENHVDKTYARIDTVFSPGYFTAPGTNPQPNPEPEPYIITAYVGEGGTVTPKGDTRVSAGGSQKYVITPDSGWRVLSVRIDGVEIGAPSEYVFENVIRDHNIFASFEPLPRYEITSAVTDNRPLSVTLTNTAPVTVAVSYFDQYGQFLSADLKSVSANIGNVTFALPFAYKARVMLFDSACCPLCDTVTIG